MLPASPRAPRRRAHTRSRAAATFSLGPSARKHMPASPRFGVRSRARVAPPLHGHHSTSHVQKSHGACDASSTVPRLALSPQLARADFSSQKFLDSLGFHDIKQSVALLDSNTLHGAEWITPIRLPAGHALTPMP